MVHFRTISIVFTFLVLFTVVYCDKYSLCIVDGKGRFKKSEKYCPKLQQPHSKVKCVLAVDRLDCLRRLSKGSVDFSVFTSEDLVTSLNAGIDDVFLTTELRFTNDTHEYQLVAVVDNRSKIKTRHDLKGRKFCHPGYGYETDWTRILSNFFESTITTPSCDEKLTITENRIKATSDFFRSSCKAGPWVNNREQDSFLKDKYPHLCELCGDSVSCSKNDKYWGRKGSLLCLTDGIGDVSWARLDDVQQHFGLTEDDSDSIPDDYSLLCPDDTTMPVNSTNPCVWVVKPWPVVASRKAVAQDIQELIASLGNELYNNWRYTLRYLLDTMYTDFVKIEPAVPVETYLYKAKGYLSANSFSGCHPPRTIWICTTSVKETAKCNWLRESATVYGIQPGLDCVRADNVSRCMEAVSFKAADIVMVPTDMVYNAMNQFDLKTLFYETTTNINNDVIVAVAKSDVNFDSWEDLRGKKACFPIYEGVAWNSVRHHLLNNTLIKYCPLDMDMANFFGSSCVPNATAVLPTHMTELCQNTSFSDNYGVLECLMSGAGEVAFISNNSLSTYMANNEQNLSINDLKIMCLTPTCHLSWANAGRAMIRKNVTDLWMKDTIDVFMILSDLFGKTHKSSTIPFTLFGTYDGTSNLMFHDDTRSLRKEPLDKDVDYMPFHYDTLLNHEPECLKVSGSSSSVSFSFIMLTAMFALNKFCINVLII